jgi:hypothetical protein
MQCAPTTAATADPRKRNSEETSGLADERFDLFDELVLDLEVPCYFGNVDDKEQLGQQQRLNCRHAEMLQPFPDPDPNGEVIRIARFPARRAYFSCEANV